MKKKVCIYILLTVIFGLTACTYDSAKLEEKTGGNMRKRARE